MKLNIQWQHQMKSLNSCLMTGWKCLFIFWDTAEYCLADTVNIAPLFLTWLVNWLLTASLDKWADVDNSRPKQLATVTKIHWLQSVCINIISGQQYISLVTCYKESRRASCFFLATQSQSSHHHFSSLVLLSKMMSNDVTLHEKSACMKQS